VCDGFFLTAGVELERGVVEAPGEADNPRILEYQLTTTKAKAWRRDQIPWCSSFANWVVLQSGVRGTGEASARGWLRWGEPIAEPVLGCIVVFWRPLPLVNGVSAGIGGHVAFFKALDGSDVIVRGGNQRNRVCDAPYPKKRLLGYRVPRLDQIPEGAT
jgi:uncharacterized protein (TIGR02594 family)